MCCIGHGGVRHTARGRQRWEAEASRPSRDLMGSRTARVDNINSVVVKTKQPECMLLLQGTWDMAAHRLPKLGLRRSDNPLDMRAPGRHNTLIQAKTLAAFALLGPKVGYSRGIQLKCYLRVLSLGNLNITTGFNCLFLKQGHMSQLPSNLLI